MKQNQCWQEQIIALLQQAQPGDKPIPQICRQAGIAQTTLYRWRQHFGAMTGPQAQPLKQREREKPRLKKRRAEPDREINARKESPAKK